jgi:hypothetical protein
MRRDSGIAGIKAEPSGNIGITVIGRALYRSSHG